MKLSKNKLRKMIIQEMRNVSSLEYMGQEPKADDMTGSAYNRPGFKAFDRAGGTYELEQRLETASIALSEVIQLARVGKNASIDFDTYDTTTVPGAIEQAEGENYDDYMIFDTIIKNVERMQRYLDISNVLAKGNL